MHIPCDLCQTKPGFLWLGGNDWVECPQCIAGRIEVIQQEIKPRGRGFIAGNTMGFTIQHPEHSKRFG